MTILSIFLIYRHKVRWTNNEKYRNECNNRLKQIEYVTEKRSVQKQEKICFL